MSLLSIVVLLVSSVILCSHGSTIPWTRENLSSASSAVDLLRDNYGCDALISSCGKKGKCCDEHDLCYKIHGCTALSWIYLCKSTQRERHWTISALPFCSQGASVKVATWLWWVALLVWIQDKVHAVQRRTVEHNGHKPMLFHGFSHLLLEFVFE